MTVILRFSEILKIDDNKAFLITYMLILVVFKHVINCRDRFRAKHLLELALVVAIPVDVNLRV